MRRRSTRHHGTETPSPIVPVALAVAALAVLGGDSLTDFAIALLIGLGVGILSTVFTASALAVVLEEKWPQNPQKASKVADPYADIDDGRAPTGAVL